MAPRKTDAEKEAGKAQRAAQKKGQNISNGDGANRDGQGPGPSDRAWQHPARHGRELSDWVWDFPDRVREFPEPVMEFPGLANPYSAPRLKVKALQHKPFR